MNRSPEERAAGAILTALAIASFCMIVVIVAGIAAKPQRGAFEMSLHNFTDGPRDIIRRHRMEREAR